jgi:excisionase family DNA binding protein
MNAYSQIGNRPTALAIEVGGNRHERRAAAAKARAGSGKFRPASWNVDDAAEQLAISRAHLYELANKGLLRLVKVGGRTTVPDSEVMRLAEGRQLEPAE